MTIALAGDPAEVLEADYTSESRIVAVYGAYLVLEGLRASRSKLRPLVAVLAKELAAYRLALLEDGRERKWEPVLQLYGIPVSFVNDLLRDLKPAAEART